MERIHAWQWGKLRSDHSILCCSIRKLQSLQEGEYTELKYASILIFGVIIGLG